MKLEIVNNVVVATSQCEEDAIALIKLAGVPKAPEAVTTKPVGPGRGNYPRRKKWQRYTSEADRILAKRASQRKYYKKIKALANAGGTPVAITKIGS